MKSNVEGNDVYEEKNSAFRNERMDNLPIDHENVVVGQTGWGRGPSDLVTGAA